MMYRRSHPFWAALAMFDCRRPNKIWSSVDETFRAAFLVTSLLLTLVPQVEEVDISDYSIHSVLRIQIKTLKSSGSPADSHGCSSTAKNKYLWDALQFSPGSKWLTPVRWLVQQGWCTLIAASRRTRSTKCSAYTYIYIYIHIHVYVYIYIYTHTCIYIYIQYVYIYIYIVGTSNEYHQNHEQSSGWCFRFNPAKHIWSMRIIIPDRTGNHLSPLRGIQTMPFLPISQFCSLQNHESVESLRF